VGGLAVGNNARKGTYYRLRTQKWLESLGYEVAPLERQQRIVRTDKKTGKQEVIFIKRDVWGADLVAKNSEHMVFVQCKSNSGDIAKGIKELSKGTWPDGDVERWVTYWPPRRRLVAGPEITVVEHQEASSC